MILNYLFSINIFVYKEETSIMDKYILYEKMDTDNNNYDKCNLLFENGNHFSILLDKNVLILNELYQLLLIKKKTQLMHLYKIIMI